MHVKMFNALAENACLIIMIVHHNGHVDVSFPYMYIQNI